jgi:hypothetical protein
MKEKSPGIEDILYIFLIMESKEYLNINSIFKLTFKLERDFEMKSEEIYDFPDNQKICIWKIG